VWLPVYLRTIDTVSGFLILVEYDSSVLTPVTLEWDGDTAHYDDTLYLHVQIAGQLQAAQDLQDEIDPNRKVFDAQISTQAADSGHAVIICAFNLGFGSGDTSQAPPRMYPTEESEMIFRLPFHVNSSMADGETVDFTYREVNETVPLESYPDMFCADCRRTNMSVDRDCEVEIEGEINTVTCTSVLYPSTWDGIFTADATPDPDIQSFSSNKLNDSVGTNNGFLLLWAVSNTDSVFITGPDVDFASDDTSIVQLYVTSPSTPGTYPYTLIARNQNSDDTATVSMLVQDDGGDPPPDEHQPVINVNTSHYVDVGNTLVFTVSATDPDNDFVTLEATTLPT
ncbi:MAG: hypothetical protein KAW61_06415, partial [candidate division Zixibacteria bacterium]|nr:hypothetical protein [candidate division Zixibacteria bacterium]